MPQTKAYTAKRTPKLDCGFTIQTGETLVTVSSRQQEKAGPLRILITCFRRKRKKNAEEPKATSASKTKA